LSRSAPPPPLIQSALSVAASQLRENIDGVTAIGNVFVQRFKPSIQLGRLHRRELHVGGVEAIPKLPDEI
jgi:hypothetical protein